MTKAQQIINENKAVVEKELRRQFRTNFDYFLNAFEQYLETCNTEAIAASSNISRDLKYVMIAFATAQREEVRKEANRMIYGKEKVSLKEKIAFHTSK